MTEIEHAQPKLKVFFDGSCPMCRAEIGVYRRCAGSQDVAFVDVSIPADTDLPPGLNRGAAMARFHVMRPDGKLLSGAEGFAQLWLALPRWRLLGRLVMLPIMLPLVELVYRGFLPIRPWLQRLWRLRHPTAPS